jgi:hypothetical protein
VLTRWHHLGGDTAAEVGQCLLTRVDVWAQRLGGMDTSPDSPPPSDEADAEDDGDDTLPITNTQRIEQQPWLELLADREQKAQSPGDLLGFLGFYFPAWKIRFQALTRQPRMLHASTSFAAECPRTGNKCPQKLGQLYGNHALCHPAPPWQ